MTLFGEVKGFLKRFVSNPMVLLALAWIVVKTLRKHTKEHYTEGWAEAISVKHLADGSELVTDKDTGRKALVKGTSIKVLEGYQARLAEMCEAETEGFPMDEFHAGIEEEYEHTEDPMTAAQIALDHLKEDKEYYTKLKGAGLAEKPPLV